MTDTGRIIKMITKNLLEALKAMSPSRRQFLVSQDIPVDAACLAQHEIILYLERPIPDKVIGMR